MCIWGDEANNICHLICTKHSFPVQKSTSLCSTFFYHELACLRSILSYHPLIQMYSSMPSSPSHWEMLQSPAIESLMVLLLSINRVNNQNEILFP